MELNTLLLIVINIQVFFSISLMFGCIYQFNRLDKDLFKYYIIAILFFAITTIFCFFRYILFPPLSDMENGIFDYVSFLGPVLGLFYFIKGTNFLATKFQSDYKKNDKLYNLVIWLILIQAVYLFFYISTIYWSKDLFNNLNGIGSVMYLVINFLALKLFIDYYKGFGGYSKK